MATASAPNAKRNRTGIFVRLPEQVESQVRYWADKTEVSVAEYVALAVTAQIQRENQDYDLPTLEIARVNQLADEVRALSSNVANLERVSVRGFESLIGLTRGDNYLLDSAAGEAEEPSARVNASVGS